jgi:hypothetical protein
VGSGSTNSGNSGHCSTCSPGLGIVKHTGILIDGIGLSSVFIEIVKHEVNGVVSNGGEEDVGKRDFTDGCVRVLGGKYSDYLSGCHFSNMI